MRVRIALPASSEASSYALAAAGHVVLFAAFFVAGAMRGDTKTVTPSMTVSLAGPRAAPAGGRPRAAARPAPAPDAPQAAKAPRDKPSDRKDATPDPPKNVARKLSGSTAQPEQLPRVDEEHDAKTPPESAREPEDDADARRGAEPGRAGIPGLPEGPVPGGIAGLGGDEPIGPNWYVQLIVARMQDAWRDRPILPAGSDPRRAVVTFVIERDGRVVDARVETPSGYALLDMSALRAVSSIGRLPPPPEAFRKDRLTARFAFELTPSEP